MSAPMLKRGEHNAQLALNGLFWAFEGEMTQGS
jgi:hypothetical protein